MASTGRSAPFGLGACLVVALLSVLLFGRGSDAATWADVDQVLEAGVQDGAYPGCVAVVGNKNVCLP